MKLTTTIILAVALILGACQAGIIAVQANQADEASVVVNAQKANQHEQAIKACAEGTGNKVMYAGKMCKVN